VQRSLKDIHQRPTQTDFIDSGKPFLTLIEKLRPSRVVITGIQAWELMPECQVILDRYKQAYRLKDGTLVWCLAVPHPSSRKKGHGFRWADIGQRIQQFVNEPLPKRSPIRK
jgi:hypothetical protein